MRNETHNHVADRDTIAIGCSAGGVDALPRVLHPLGAELRAALLIVQHLAADRDPLLLHILRRATAMPVAWAEQGMMIENGRTCVAPPNVHMVVEDDHLLLTGGPRENHSRPSIDRLFRSVAAMRGPRAIGVLLTGMLDDGVAGLRDIQAAGGLAIVQDPADAAFPELPSRALAAIDADLVLGLDAIGPTLARLAGTPSERTRAARAASRSPSALALEAAMDRSGVADPAAMDRLGARVPMSCPECRGPMWELGDQHHRRYRCYLGHVATAREILRQSDEQLETALWSAVRALRDRASTFDALAGDAQRGDQQLAGELYRQRAKEAMDQAELARKFLLDVLDARPSSH